MVFDEKIMILDMLDQYFRTETDLSAMYDLRKKVQAHVKQHGIDRSKHTSAEMAVMAAEAVGR